MGNLLHDQAIQAFKNGDEGFWVDDKCDHCRTCERICSRSNIKINNGKPAWNHNCELCFACIQWCPQKAIQYQKGSRDLERTHHPEVKLNDVLLR